LQRGCPLVQQTVYSKDAKRYSVAQRAPASERPVRLLGVHRVRNGVKMAGIAALAVISLLGFGFFLFWSLIEHEPRHDIGRADAIVALTGGEARIPEAVKLLAQGKGRRLLISGVNPATTRTELAVLTPNSKHLYRCCIDMGRVARDTIGNADETSAWVRERRFKSLIVVTASYHMPRSLAELRRTLPDVELIPYPVQPRNVHVNAWWAYPGTLQLLLTEYVKYMPAALRCWGAQLGRGAGPFGSVRQCLNRARSV
jgi:uncharacterized SAM-binding protein YcdF (DUF218 family)